MPSIATPLLLALSLCLAALPAQRALAWGEEGHRMVAEIASRHLTPEATRQVADILRNDRLADGNASHRRSLAEIASWADEIKDYPWGRKMSSWHFDDMPVCGAPDRSSYCKRGGCASVRLEREIEILKNSAASTRKRNEALKWVVHLMGDIHQPLHAANHKDRGGNLVQVTFFGVRDNAPYGAMNLHAIWDVHMVKRLVTGRGGEEAIVGARMSAADIAAWERGSIADWMNESNGIARTLVYPALPVSFACSRKIVGVVNIGEAYYSRAAPVIQQQIEKAGIRLAAVLNRALGARP